MEPRAVAGSPRKFFAVMPNLTRRALIGPYCGLNIAIHTIARATVEMTLGR